MTMLEHAGYSTWPTLPGLELTPTGATTSDELTPDALTHTLTSLRRTEAAWSWIVGDLILAAVHHFGPTRGLTLIAEADLSQAHIARCVAVAERIPHGSRRPTLSWSHHELVAGIDPHNQTRLLDLAETETLSVRQLRAVIDQERADLTPELDLVQPARLPTPPVSQLRAILEEQDDAWVLWQPSSGTMRKWEAA